MPDTPPSPKGAPSVQWAVMGLSPASTKPVLYRTTTSPQGAKDLVYTAITDGATVILIRRLHLPPEGKPLPAPTSPIPEGDNAKKAT